MRRCENAVDRLPALAATLRLDIERAQHTVDQASAAAAQPFKHADELDQARGTLARIEEEMALKDPSHEIPNPQEQGCAECGAQPGEPCRPYCTAQASRIDQAEDTATLASRQATGLELRERLAKITAQTRATTPEDDRRHQGRTMDNQPEIGT